MLKELISTDSKKIALATIPIILALLMLVAFLFFSGDKYSKDLTIGDGVETFKELSDKFAELADKKGGAYAYEVLRHAPLPPQTDLHLLGHVVGEELYKQEGVGGIRLCTPDFRNACSHSIVIGALAEFGESALPLIRDACKEAPGGSGAYTMCFHGLGHGVFAGYGYELPETIEFCKLTGTKEYHQREYIECFGGAIMELAGGGGHDPQLWEEARKKYITEPLAPCLSGVVPRELKEICLTYLTPDIWKAAGIELGNFEPAKLKEAFGYCDDIATSETDLRRACYEGFGKEFVPLAGARDIRDISAYSNEDFNRAIAWCTEAGNEQGSAWCIASGLDSIFWGGENDPSASFRYCELVTDLGNPAYRTACYSRLAGAIGFFVHAPYERSRLCSQLPHGFQPVCK